ncbi:MAG: hypothetical protein ACLGH8_13315 [Bacteroidia bacterium]
MKNLLFLAAMGACTALSAQNQNHFNQYSIEASAGLNHARNPDITGFHHFDAGFRYMHTEFWGAKLDYGYDMYTANDASRLKTTQNRLSLQAVYNLGRALRVNDIAPHVFNVLLHAGGGPTILKTEDGLTDKGTHAIIGGTAQFYISPRVALMGDLSGILNFGQNYRYNGRGRYDHFTGKTATLTVGLTYYMGRNGNAPDWH